MRALVAGSQLVEEDLRGGDGTEKINVHHFPVIGVELRSKRPQQHDPCIVDQYVRTAQLGPNPAGGACQVFVPQSFTDSCVQR